MGVTLTLLDNWLHNRYLKSNQLDKMLTTGALSPVFQGISMKQQVRSQGGKAYTIPLWAGQKRTSSRNSQVTHDRNKAGATGQRVSFIYDKMIENFDDVHFDRQTLMATRVADVGSFTNEFETDIMQSRYAMETDILKSLYGGNVAGAIGKVASAVNFGSTGKSVVTLADDSIIQMFQPGMYVEFAAAKYDGSADSRREADQSADVRIYKILRVLEHELKIEIEGSKTDVDNVVANDHIWREGDYLMSHNADQEVGMLDYVPSSVTSTPFMKVNRAVSPARLAGYYLALTNASPGRDNGERVHHGLIRATTRVSSIYPRFAIDKWFCHPEVNILLSESTRFSDKVRYIEDKKDQMKYGSIGFTAFTVEGGAKGKIPVVMDPHCPKGKMVGCYQAAKKFRYLSMEGKRIIDFKKQSGSRILIDTSGGNSDMVKLEAYTHYEDYLPGAGAVLDISAFV